MSMIGEIIATRSRRASTLGSSVACSRHRGSSGPKLRPQAAGSSSSRGALAAGESSALESIFPEWLALRNDPSWPSEVCMSRHVGSSARQPDVDMYMSPTMGVNHQKAESYAAELYSKKR